MSMFRTLVVLMNLIIGVGLLGLPYCFRCGIVLELLVVAFFGVASVFSFHFLIDSSFAVGQSIDFSRLMTHSFGRKFEWIPQLVMFITFFGFGIVHLQAACSLFDSCLNELSGVPTWCHNRWFLIGVPATVIDYPLILLKSLKTFSNVSLFTCALIFLYVVHSAVYLVVYTERKGFDPNSELRWVEFNGFFLSSLSIQAFAYACHPLIGPALEKLKMPTQTRQYKTMVILTVVASCCYALGGLLPYLTLFDAIKDPVVFTYYDKGQWFTIVTKALYAIFVIFTTPLILYSSRLSLNDFLFKSEFTPIRFNTIGILLVTACIILAVTVKSLDRVFGFVGGVTCNMIVYILPALYYLKLCSRGSRFKRGVAYPMIPVGVILIGVCLYAEITGPGEDHN